MNKLDSILVRILKVKEQDLLDELTMNDVVLWDSLKHMELIVTIENELEIELSAEDIMEMTDVKAIRTITAGLKE
jgi:acyl carrier protein